MTISKIKEELSSMILNQQNLIKILLNYIEKIVTSSNNVDIDFSENILKILEDLKSSINYCNNNISLLKEANSCPEEPFEDFSNKYLDTVLLVNKNTIFVENFLYSLLPYTELKFSKNDTLDSNNNISTQNDDNINLKENTLIISETSGKVILPYYINELENIKANAKDKTYEQIIQENYTLSIDQFKTPFIARFREAFKLAHSKEKKSVKFAFDLGTELLFNYNLHPAIISACRNLDELDIYLDYLENNETEKFDCFNIIFEIPPTISNKKGSKHELY